MIMKVLDVKDYQSYAFVLSLAVITFCRHLLHEHEHNSIVDEPILQE